MASKTIHDTLFIISHRMFVSLMYVCVRACFCAFVNNYGVSIIHFILVEAELDRAHQSCAYIQRLLLLTLNHGIRKSHGQYSLMQR